MKYNPSTKPFPGRTIAVQLLSAVSEGWKRAALEAPEMEHSTTLLDLRPDLRSKLYQEKEEPYPFKRIFLEDLLRLRDFFLEHFQGATFLVNNTPVTNPWAVEYIEPASIRSISFEHPKVSLYYGLDGIRYRYETSNDAAFNQKQRHLEEQIQTTLREHKRGRQRHRKRIARGVLLVEGLVLGACLGWFSPLASVAVIGLTIAGCFVDEIVFLNLLGTAFWGVMSGLFFYNTMIITTGMIAVLVAVVMFMIYLGHMALFDLLDTEYG